MNLLFVAIGGVFGALGRYYFASLFSRYCSNFKNYISTIFVNAIGSFALGAILGSILDSSNSSSYMFLGITVGLIGSTYSTFALDFMKIIKQKSWIEGMGYLIVTMFTSVGLFCIGFYLFN
jgi:CrcB protein